LLANHANNELAQHGFGVESQSPIDKRQDILHEKARKIVFLYQSRFKKSKVFLFSLVKIL